MMKMLRLPSVSAYQINGSLRGELLWHGRMFLWTEMKKSNGQAITILRQTQWHWTCLACANDRKSRMWSVNEAACWPAGPQYVAASQRRSSGNLPNTTDSQGDCHGNSRYQSPWYRNPHVSRDNESSAAWFSVSSTGKQNRGEGC